MQNNTLKALGIAIGASLSLMFATDIAAAADELKETPDLTEQIDENKEEIPTISELNPVEVNTEVIPNEDGTTTTIIENLYVPDPENYDIIPDDEDPDDYDDAELIKEEITTTTAPLIKEEWDEEIPHEEESHTVTIVDEEAYDEEVFHEEVSHEEEVIDKEAWNEIIYHEGSEGKENADYHLTKEEQNNLYEKYKNEYGYTDDEITTGEEYNDLNKYQAITNTFNSDAHYPGFVKADTVIKIGSGIEGNTWDGQNDGLEDLDGKTVGEYATEILDTVEYITLDEDNKLPEWASNGKTDGLNNASVKDVTNDNDFKVYYYAGTDTINANGLYGVLVAPNATVFTNGKWIGTIISNSVEGYGESTMWVSQRYYIKAIKEATEGYNETIPHEATYKTITVIDEEAYTEIVHHDEVSHEEKVIDKEAWVEVIHHEAEFGEPTESRKETWGVKKVEGDDDDDSDTDTDITPGDDDTDTDDDIIPGDDDTDTDDDDTDFDLFEDDDDDGLDVSNEGDVLGARRRLDHAVLGKRRSPKTGDDMDAALAALLASLTGAGIISGKLKKDKKHKKKLV